MVKIYGVSDDLIEVEGDIREEFSFFPDDEKERRLLAFSDGTVLGANYDADGIWRLAVVARGSCTLEKQEGSATEDTPDIVTMTGDVRWVVFGKEIALPQ